MALGCRGAGGPATAVGVSTGRLNSTAERWGQPLAGCHGNCPTNNRSGTIYKFPSLFIEKLRPPLFWILLEGRTFPIYRTARCWGSVSHFGELIFRWTEC